MSANAAGMNVTPNSAATGPADHTAGPHKSDAANKLDPRVDSDLDGSRTVGDNKTTSAQNEPLDAAKHRPSMFQAIHGDPTVEHSNPQHSLAGRHGDRRGSLSGTFNHYGSGAS